MIERYKEAVLTKDLPEKGLKAGDVGTVVEIHDAGAGYSLEFFSPSGETVAVATVAAKAVRPAGDDEVLHARRLEESAAG
ncbi:DUF4926 domain-containing protein [soil metagenome]